MNKRGGGWRIYKGKSREEGAWRYEVERPAGRLLSHGSNTERGGGGQNGEANRPVVLCPAPGQAVLSVFLSFPQKKQRAKIASLKTASWKMAVMGS
jgi:hypothetical protein